MGSWHSIPLPIRTYRHGLVRNECWNALRVLRCDLSHNAIAGSAVAIMQMEPAPAPSLKV